MPVICNVEDCNSPAVLKRPKTGDPMCKQCFFFAFETEIHVTIVKGNLFKRGNKVAIGASGGKDSTVLAYVLKLLNEQYDYGLDLFLLSIDEGITGYRDDSLETVKQNRDDYQLPLKILSYKDLYGWTMDEIVAQIGHKNNCTFCGVFRRQALDRGAEILGADIIVTGHNADDIAETVIMNILRGDIARLSRCTNIITEGEGSIPRCKPLKYAYEKEIVMYAHFKELVYFSTECIYAPNAYRGFTREYIKDVERIRPSCILDIIHSGEIMRLKKSIKLPKRRTCSRCGFIASQEICKACVLLEGLNTGMPLLGVRKSNKAKKIMGLKVNDGSENKTTKKETRIKSKRKIKRENKKKATCEEACSSNCRSQIEKLPIINDTDISSLSLEENISKEQDCTITDYNFELPILLISSDDEIVDTKVQPKNEKITYKCPPRLRVNAKPKLQGITDDTNSSSDEEIFDFEAFTELLGSINVESSDNESQGLEFQLKDIVKKVNDEYENDSQNPNFQFPRELCDYDESQPSSMQSDDLEGLPSCLEKQNINKRESPCLVKESQYLTSQSTDSRDNIQPLITATKSQNLQSLSDLDHEKQSLNDCIQNDAEESVDVIPITIKANQKRVGPSLILPEMMYKAKNNLDF